MSKPTIALAIMMKNEEAIIQKSIESAKPYVDSIVILDTGSSDESISLARASIGDMPGLVAEAAWKGFAKSRNELLDLAGKFADYALCLDADSLFVGETGETRESLREQLNHPTHLVKIIHDNGMTYPRHALIHRDSGALYRGVVHEYLALKENTVSGTLISGFHILNDAAGTSARDGNPNKYLEDARALKAELDGDPGDLRPRYTFYLAQSYRDARAFPLALEYYEKRVALGGWREEVYYAALQVARHKLLLKFPDDEVIAAFLTAYEILPTRGESLYGLAKFARETSRWNLAHMIASWGARITEPENALFSEPTIYTWGFRYELSINSWWVNKFSEGMRLCEDLLKEDLMSEGEREATEKNLRLYQGVEKPNLTS